MDATEADMTLLKYLHTVGYRIGAIFWDDDRIVADQCTHLTFGTSGLVFIAISPVGHGLRRGGPHAGWLRACVPAFNRGWPARAFTHTGSAATSSRRVPFRAAYGARSSTGRRFPVGVDRRGEGVSMERISAFPDKSGRAR